MAEQHESLQPDRKRSILHWRPWPTILILLFLVLIAGAAMFLTSWDEGSAGNYLQVLSMMLSWPTLGFALILSIVLLFRHELAELIDRFESIEGRGLKGTFRDTRTPKQAEVPPSQDPPNIQSEPTDQVVELEPTEPSDDDTESNVEQPSGSALDDLKNRVVGLQSRNRRLVRDNRRLRDEAERWLFRYLALFLTRPTIEALRRLAELEESVSRDRAISQLVGFEYSPERRIKVDQLDDDMVILAGRLEPDDVVRALSVLEHYRFFVSTDHGYVVTIEARKFLGFLDSSEWRELQRELRDSRPPHRYGY